MQFLNNPREPLAIAGIGCRFPGGIRGPRQFWEFLRRGGNAITDVPPDRWRTAAFYSKERAAAGKLYMQRGGFIDDIAMFEPEFFGISPREAAFMDPQQRLLLEVTWEALEDGGTPPESVAGSQTGVYIGLFTHDYENLLTAPSEREWIAAHSATGMSTTIAANRISHVFDLRGPSMVVDTACSSSLVAVHLACESLWRGETDLALAGGVNLQIRPEMAIALSKAGFLAEDGFSKAFDARADGYSRADGCGMIVLKPLKRARADGNHVYAVIRGTAVNQDGHTEGITSPSGHSQVAVLREALRTAGVRPEQVGYVEAHGTGTAVGDPIEAGAIGEVLGEGRDSSGPCLIGSVKTNIGHTESAAGIAGLIKAALMVEQGAVPPNLHFVTPNPAIPFDWLKLRVPVELEPWPGEGRRIAGVNSFGFGGTNAHAIIEGVPAARIPQPVVDGGSFAVPFSAHSPECLRAVVRDCREALRGGIAPADLVHTLAFQRGRHQHRLTVVARSIAELEEQLDGYLAGLASPAAIVGCAMPRPPEPIAFVCSGMGQQWRGMGQSLYRGNAEFRAAVDRCDELFAALTGEWRLIDELMAPPDRSRVDETRIAQPLILAVQLGLVEAWRALGVAPAAVVGHSVGEVAAFHVAGVFGLEDAVRICFHRSRLQHTLTGAGRMLAAAIAEAEARELIAGFEDCLAVAAVNGPSSVTLTGDAEMLGSMASWLEQRGQFARFVNVDVPYHSPAMDSILDEFRQSIEGVRASPPVIPLYSTVTGGRVESITDPLAYWSGNIREPVRFQQAAEAMLDDGFTAFVEIGGHAVLAPSLAECMHGRDGTIAAASLRRDEDDPDALLKSIARLHNAGYPVDWSKLGAAGGRFVQLPSYPWQRAYYWRESPASAHTRSAINPENSGPRNPLLGIRMDTANPCWTARAGSVLMPFLADHIVEGEVVYPAAAYMASAIAAARELDSGARQIAGLEISRALLLPAEGEIEVQLSFDAGSGFAFHSRQKDQWIRHAAGTLSRHSRGAAARLDERSLRDRCPRRVQVDAFYESLRRRGLLYGPSFRLIAELFTGEHEAFAVIDAGKLAGRDDYDIHPAILDAALQVCASLSGEGTYVPVRVERFRLDAQPGARSLCSAELTGRGPGTIRACIRLTDTSGNPVAEVVGLELRALDKPDADDGIGRHLYEYVWVRDGDPGEALPSPREIADALRPAAAKLAQADPVRGYGGEAGERLQACTTAYIAAALRSLGFQFKRGARFDAGQLAGRLAVDERHYRWFNRLLEHLLEEGILSRDGARYRVMRDPGPVDLCRMFAEATRKHPEFHAELALLNRCGRHLPQILRGEREGLELVFADGSTLPEHLYRDSPTFSFHNRMARLAVEEIRKHLDSERRLRILEVGGGTGSLTSSLLPSLAAATTEYVFTDVGLGFVNRARDLFSGYPFVEFQQFDLEADPAAQGLSPHSYDLVLGSAVLHATKSIEESIAHLLCALKPGGLLLLIEPNPALRWLDVVFGSLPGWWRFTDRERTLLPADAWRAALEKGGFETCAAIGDLDHNDRAPQSLIVAQASARVAPAPLPPVVSGAWVVVGRGGMVADALDAAGAAVTRAGSVEALEACLRECVVAPAVVFDAGGKVSSSSVVSDCSVLCNELLRASQAIVRAGQVGSFWIVTRDAQSCVTGGAALNQSALWGLGRTAITEYPELAICLVDLSSDPDAEELAQLLGVLEERGAEDEIAIRGRRRYRRRATRVRRGVELRPKAGDGGAPEPGMVAVEVKAAGLNFKDLVRSTGAPGLGLEFSGVVTAAGPGVTRVQAGDLVVGLGSNCFARHIRTDAHAVAIRPRGMSDEIAAGIPLAFLTAWYGLKRLARLQAGERILIHTGAGAVGLAAIQVAGALGARIFGTAGSAEKRDYLLSLGVEYAGDSRTLDFADEVLALTAGEGVDVALNTLAGEGALRTLATLRPVTGRFVDIVNVRGRTTFENLDRGLSIQAFDLETVGRLQPALAGALFDEVMAEFAASRLAPLPTWTMPLGRLDAAMKTAGRGRHIGKITFSHEPAMQQIPPFRLQPCESYLIAGGLGGFGLATAEWLVRRGARHIALVGRHEAPTGTLDALRATGAEVVELVADVSRRAEVEALIERIHTTMPPLGGVIHAAMVLNDSPIDGMTASAMDEVLAPKVAGAWNLHRATLGIPLEFFICYSSMSAFAGNSGQANYCAANAFLDALAIYRRNAGLPGLSVAWGGIAETGYVAAHLEIQARLKRQGIGLMPPAKAFDALEYALCADLSNVAASFNDWPAMARRSSTVARSPRFKLLRPRRELQTEPAASGGPGAGAPDLTAVIARESAAVLGLDPSRLGLDEPLESKGFDSLLAVELSIRIEQATGVAPARMGLMQPGLTVRRLALLIEQTPVVSHAS